MTGERHVPSCRSRLGSAYWVLHRCRASGLLPSPWEENEGLERELGMMCLDLVQQSHLEMSNSLMEIPFQTGW